MEEKSRYTYPHRLNFERPKPSRFSKIVRITIAALVYGIVIVSLLVYLLISPPKNFRVNSFFEIEEGMTFDEIATELKNQGYARSKIVLKIIHRGIFLERNGAVAGDYFFEEPLTAFEIIRAIDTGDYNSDLIKVTIPEGLNKFEIAEKFAELLPHFDKDAFIKLADEGYVFPDTYFVTGETTADEIVEIMRRNFDDKIADLLPEIEQTGRSLSEIITMASIVETEARQFETRRMVAGILWNRIDENIPLQVDVSFKYINGKTTFDLTMEDLEIDSPYNTYRHTGLPPTPIANPSLDSIRATITPLETDYLYFLTGHDGVMYYSSDFDGHKANREKYLQ